MSHSSQWSVIAVEMGTPALLSDAQYEIVSQFTRLIVSVQVALSQRRYVGRRYFLQQNKSL